MQRLLILSFALFLLSRFAFSLPATSKWSEYRLPGPNRQPDSFPFPGLPKLPSKIDNKKKIAIVRAAGSSDQANTPFYILLDKREPFSLVPLLKTQSGKRDSACVANLGVSLYYDYRVLEDNDYLLYYAHYGGKRALAPGEDIEQVALLISINDKEGIFKECFYPEVGTHERCPIAEPSTPNISRLNYEPPSPELSWYARNLVKHDYPQGKESDLHWL